MEISKRLQVKRHLLMPGQTINAILKKFNYQDVNDSEMKLLVEQFKLYNSQTVFKPGMSVFVPILEKHYAQAFNYPSQDSPLAHQS